MVNYLEMGGSNGFLFKNWRFQKFPIWKWVVPMVFCLGTEGSKSSLLRNGWFQWLDRKSTRLNSSHWPISYAVFCLKKKKKKNKKQHVKKNQKQSIDNEASYDKNQEINDKQHTV